MPEKNSVVAGGIPVMMGTRKVAPNMATTCCMPTPMVRGHASRSSGATTWPGLMVLPVPCSFHLIPSMLMGRNAFQGVPRGGEDQLGPEYRQVFARTRCGQGHPRCGKSQRSLEVATMESNQGPPRQ